MLPRLVDSQLTFEATVYEMEPPELEMATFWDWATAPGSAAKVSEVGDAVSTLPEPPEPVPTVNVTGIWVLRVELFVRVTFTAPL